LVKSVDIPFDIGGKEVVLVDDVLYTGRTTRAAIDALFSVGRPGKIRLAVLIDRGHRELPIRPDYVGKNVPTSHKEAVRVNLEPTDGKTDVELYEREEEE
jgi:pyrimidine operon attenuation protein/uracil phosphoribosyltransferase